MKRLMPILLALCALSYSWTISNAFTHSSSESLSPKDRIEVFETIWKTINDNYYNSSFNGVDWVAVRERYRPRIDPAKTEPEFYALIKQMVRELHDLHTAFMTPTDQSLDTGLSVNQVEGKVAIMRVAADSEAAKAGVQPGMIVRQINGKPVAERIAQLRAALGHSSSDQADHFVIFEKKGRGLGYETMALEMSEFQKMDGGLSCLSIRW